MDETISPDQQKPKLSPEAIVKLKRDLAIDYVDEVGDYGAAHNVCGDLGLKMTRENSDQSLKQSPDGFMREVAAHAIHYYEFLQKALALPGDQWPDHYVGDPRPEDYAEALERVSQEG